MGNARIQIKNTGARAQGCWPLQGTVLAYKKIEDRFVDAFLEKVENAAQKEDEEAQADAGTRD